MNKRFAAQLRQYGHKYTFEGQDVSSLDSDDGDEGSAKDLHLYPMVLPTNAIHLGDPSYSEEVSLGLRQNLVQTHDQELAGYLNPLLIGEEN